MTLYPDIRCNCNDYCTRLRTTATDRASAPLRQHPHQAGKALFKKLIEACDVMAVPGSALSRAANGVNALLRDGSAPALDVDDVLVALGLDHRRLRAPVDDSRVRPRADDLAVYRVCARRASTVGEVADELGVPVVDAAMSLARLEQQGWLAQVEGWFEVSGSPFS